MRHFLIKSYGDYFAGDISTEYGLYGATIKIVPDGNNPIPGMSPNLGTGVGIAKCYTSDSETGLDGYIRWYVNRIPITDTQVKILALQTDTQPYDETTRPIIYIEYKSNPIYREDEFPKYDNRFLETGKYLYMKFINFPKC